MVYANSASPTMRLTLMTCFVKDDNFVTNLDFTLSHPHVTCLLIFTRPTWHISDIIVEVIFQLSSR